MQLQAPSFLTATAAGALGPRTPDPELDVPGAVGGAGRRIAGLASLASRGLRRFSDALGEASAEAERRLALFERGEDIRRSLRTPAEIFADTVNELQELFDEAAISAETLARGFDKAAGDLVRSAELGLARAEAQAISFGTFDPTAALRGGPGQRAVERNTERTAEATEAIVRSLVSTPFLLPVVR